MRITPPVGGIFRRSKQPLIVDGIAIPENRVIQIVLAPSNQDGIGDFESFRPQRHLEDGSPLQFMPFGGGERVCLGKSLAELEIRLMVVGLFRKLSLTATPDQNFTLKQLPSPTPIDGLLVKASN